MGFYKNIGVEIQPLPITPDIIKPVCGVIYVGDGVGQFFIPKIGERYYIGQGLVDRVKEIYDGYLSQDYRRRWTRLDKRIESTSRVIKAVPAEDAGFIYGTNLKCDKCVFYYTCLCEAIDCDPGKELVFIDEGNPDRVYGLHDDDSEKN